MRISPAITRRLALIDPNFRYGVGHIPGHGQTFFLSKLVNGDKLRRSANDRPLASLAWDLNQRLVVMYDRDARPVPDALERPGWVPFLMSWPGQANGNGWVTTGSHAAWLEYNQKPIMQIAEDIRLGAIQNGYDIGSEVEEAADYAADQTEFYAKHNWQTDTTDRTVTKEELRNLEGKEGCAVRRLQRTLEGFDVKEHYARQLLWENGLGLKPKG